MNGVVRPCSEFRFSARVGRRVLKLHQFKESGGLRGFEFPDEFEAAEKIDFIARARGGWFGLDQLESHSWRGTWELGIEHRPFSQEYGYLYDGKRTNCFGYIADVNSEPARLTSTTNCK